jgi:predicted site-specific integrase-resolvase
MKKLSEYAKEHNVTYRTAWNHFHRGLISGAYQLPTGTVVICDNRKQEVNRTEYVVTYARVSSSENKTNLQKQSQRLIDYCNAKGWKTSENIFEIGSGINDNRPKLLKLLKEKKATKLVVEHKDRLTRFGFNYIKCICESINCEIVILNETSGEKEDIVQDFVSIITSFCAKIYGQRRSKRNTEKLIEELKTIK